MRSEEIYPCGKLLDTACYERCCLPEGHKYGCCPEWNYHQYMLDRNRNDTFFLTWFIVLGTANLAVLCCIAAFRQIAFTWPWWWRIGCMAAMFLFFVLYVFELRQAYEIRRRLKEYTGKRILQE